MPDINILVYAHREDAPRHFEYRQWLEALLRSESAFAVHDLVLSGFLRVVTHPRIFNPPTPMRTALLFDQEIRERPNCVPATAGPRCWDIFRRLCSIARVKENLVPDAYLAAIPIESGHEWCTADRDYARFPGLKWRHPLDPPRAVSQLLAEV